MKTNILFILAFLLIGNIAFASNNDNDIIWGQTGHRAVGEIATKHLSKSVLRKVKELLDGQSLAMISTYADDIKSDRAYRKYSTWHYVNLNDDETYQTSKKNPKGDLVTGIKECVKVLKDKNSSIEAKRFHLKMLVHLVGDLHQPMHIGRKEDKGGNTVQVQWHGK